MRSNEQVQITIPGQKDIKQPPPVQEEASWSQEDDFLPRFFEFTRACRMTDDDAAFKLYWEVCAYLEQNPRSLIPAPMVQPEQSNSFPPAPQAQFGLPEELMPPQPTYLDPNLLFTTPRSTPTPRVTNTYSAFGASGYYPQPESLQGPGGSNNQMPGLPSGPSLQINVSSTVSQNSVIDVDQVPTIQLQYWHIFSPIMTMVFGQITHALLLPMNLSTSRRILALRVLTFFALQDFAEI